jgi:hypothetical protein
VSVNRLGGGRWKRTAIALNETSDRLAKLEERLRTVEKRLAEPGQKR